MKAGGQIVASKGITKAAVYTSGNSPHAELWTMVRMPDEAKKTQPP